MQICFRCCTEENGDELEISPSADFAVRRLSFGGLYNFWSNFDLHGQCWLPLCLYCIFVGAISSSSSSYMLNGLFSRTTWVSQYQKGKPLCILLKQEMMGWQWHQLDHIQIICTSLQADNHTSTPSLNFYGPYAFPDTQPTVSKHWRVLIDKCGQFNSLQLALFGYGSFMKIFNAGKGEGTRFND